MAKPRKRRLWAGAIAVTVGVAVWVWLAPAWSSDDAPQARAVPPAVGSAGTVFGPIASASPATAGSSAPVATAVQPPTPDEDALRLWPHLRQGEPTREQKAQVQAQWNRFAQEHPDNLYVPAHLQASLTPAQASAARQRLDNTTAVVAQQAAQTYALRYAAPDQPPPGPPAQPDPAVQRDFLDYKIRELQSRLQLVDYYLANGQPSAEKRAIALKDIQQWTHELESLRQARASIPSS